VKSVVYVDVLVLFVKAVPFVVFGFSQMRIVSDIAIFVLKRDDKLQLTN